MRYLDTGDRDPKQSLAHWLKVTLSEDILELRFQSGFFSQDALGLLLPTLKISAQEDRTTHVLIGSNDGCTVRAHVTSLVQALGLPRSHAKLGVVNFAGAFFHPKVYHVVRADGTQAAYVGSANFTASGLALHIEAGISLDTREGDAEKQIAIIGQMIDAWFDATRKGLLVVKSTQTVSELAEQGLLRATSPPKKKQVLPLGPSGKKGSRPHLSPLLVLPGVVWTPESGDETQLLLEEEQPEGVEADTLTTPASKPHVVLASAPRPGLPQYLLFAPNATQPTYAKEALSGGKLPGGAIGLIIHLNKDSARHFRGQGGTANISLPVAAAPTLRFGIFGKHSRPSAKFDLQLRYLGDSVMLGGGTVDSNVMGYGFATGEPGHRDIRLLLPKEVTALAQTVKQHKFAPPADGDLALLEWPRADHPTFRLTFVQPGSALAEKIKTIFDQAKQQNEAVGRRAAWLPLALSPDW
jgi:hypothetical protein